MAPVRSSTVWRPKRRPVGGSAPPGGTTVSRAPPCPRAITGRPEAMASSGVMPKSSSVGKTKARQRAKRSATRTSSSDPRNSTLGPAMASRRRASGPVPTTSSRRRRHQDPRERARRGSEVLVIEVPDVPHGREAVADVQRPRRDPYALGDRMARGQDQVIPAEVEAGDGGGKERQVPSIRAGRARQPLDERGDHATPLDDGRDGAGEVEQGEEVGVGEELAEGLEAALAAPH